MQTLAYFENIQQHIITELNAAKSSVIIAVAWFTDNVLFDILCKLADKGISIELLLMDDEINKSSGINYDALRMKGGKVWMINSSNDSNNIMHNKFCIIDQTTVINGSYNWTKKAKSNSESITIIKDNPALAKDFIKEIHQIIEKYFGKDAESNILDYDKVRVRFETLKNFILLEDNEDIINQLHKLDKSLKHIKVGTNNGTITDLINYIERKNYREAVRLIDDFINRFKQLTTSNVLDIDGNIYDTVQIGTQLWITKNLNSCHFRNGDIIPEAKTNQEWNKASANKQPAWCYYDNNPENGKVYGKLYNWYAVNDKRNICPAGWHIPEVEEFEILLKFLDGKYTACDISFDGFYWDVQNIEKKYYGFFSNLLGGMRVGHNISQHQIMSSIFDNALKGKKEPVIEVDWEFLFGVRFVHNYGSLWSISEGYAPNEIGIGAISRTISRTVSGESEIPAQTFGIHKSYEKYTFHSFGKGEGRSVRCLRNY